MILPWRLSIRHLLGTPFFHARKVLPFIEIYFSNSPINPAIKFYDKVLFHIIEFLLQKIRIEN